MAAAICEVLCGKRKGNKTYFIDYRAHVFDRRIVLFTECFCGCNRSEVTEV